ncbi:MAG: ATP-binding cassette domain-containing protein [Clostridia bacterium]|jgi:putative ABC transport system ATP-binding protein|nr:ATP-binding cassette domain-containing protein [uncultured Acetatifactor sp.]MCI8980516.1 ATP-binding cassette domain-containing protein [Clostridia bacterium]MCI9650334.1 ATP-binding cassette domain-containing protein [Lachnospiraceae bacterium]
MIELKNITKSFGNNTIFDKFNCIIESGEFLGIKGKSGSGKSTLLNIIGLLEKCDSGEIIIDGKEVHYNDKKQIKYLLRKKIGYLFQNFALIDDFSVLKNLSIGLEDKSKKERITLIQNVLNGLNLQVDINKEVFKLSGGEQQRIAIARVMLQDKSIILADEPTASVDPVNRDIILEILKKLNQSGKTIVLVSHDDYVIRQASRVIQL